MFSAIRHRVNILRDKWPLYERYLRVRRFVNQGVSRGGGFFIEAGANDGFAQSITAIFEKRDHWKGLLIEPVPRLAASCRINRPRAIVEECALIAPDFGHPSVTMTDVNLMSVVRGAMKSLEAETTHIQLGAAVQGVEPKILTVPARTLSSILNQHQIAKIDLFVLDVEGYELQALKGLDFTRWQPSYILCEARFREEVDAFLLEQYRPVAEMGDYDVLYEYRRIG